MKTTGPGQSALLLIDIIKILSDLDIPYATIGALAASFYGPIRGSIDADALISIKNRSPEFKGLDAALKNKDIEVKFNKGEGQDPIQGILRIRDIFHNQVDLILGIRGMDEELFERTRATSFMNSQIRMIGVEDFMAMKIFAGSPKDIQDAIGVLEVSAKEINLPLLRRLTQKFGKKELAVLNKLLEQHYKCE